MESLWRSWCCRLPLRGCIDVLDVCQFLERVGYEHWLVELLMGMGERDEGFADKLHLDYFDLVVQLDEVWFVDRNGY